VRDEIDDVSPCIEPAQVRKRSRALKLRSCKRATEMQQSIAEAIGAKDASVFDAHLLVVEDRR
jgi:hypothetical protein